MLDPKYSVLMSVYFKEIPEYFIQSIESMLNQSIVPDEIVIVKDGPLTSELEDVIKYYGNYKPELFKFVTLEKNMGLGLALNEGLKQCKNELVARMDTDDISVVNRCELQLIEFELNPNLILIGAQTLEFENDIKNVWSSRTVPISNKDIIKFSKRRSPFNHPTVMFKKTPVLIIGGYSGLSRKEDLDLFIRIIIEGYECKNLNQFLLYYRVNLSNQ
jgi:glycosyltransferase involved in cell wall biosynthesis